MNLLTTFSVIAGLVAPAISSQIPAYGSANTPTLAESCDVMGASATLIGGGTVRAKDGNTYTIDSDDDNTYFAESLVSYLVGASVLHSDPVNGWVEILGHTE